MAGNYKRGRAYPFNLRNDEMCSVLEKRDGFFLMLMDFLFTEVIIMEVDYN